MDYNKIIDIVHEMKPMVFDKSKREDIHFKGAADFVTQVDLSISQAVGQRLRQLYPDIGFMSEEEDNGRLAPTRWILDPIDGTTNLVFGLQTSSVSLALYDTDHVEFGVVYDPYREETFHAVRGRGAFLNGSPMGKRPDRPLAESLIEFGAGYTNKENSKVSFDLAREVFDSCLDLRRMCSTALAICYIAAGRLDGYFERKIKPWDYAAAGLILKECGGAMSDWEGRELPYDREGTIVCGGAGTYQELLGIVGRYSGRFVV